MRIFLCPIDYDSADYLTESIASYTDTLLHWFEDWVVGDVGNGLALSLTLALPKVCVSNRL